VQRWADPNKRVSAIIDVEFNTCGSIWGKDVRLMLAMNCRNAG
jgi:hypothetical protein